MDAESLLFGLLMLGLTGGMFAVVVALAVQAGRHYRKNLALAAAMYRGRYVSGGFLRNGWIEFEVDGSPAELTYCIGSRNAPPLTRVRFRWAAPESLRVAPEGSWAKLRKFFGAQDIQIGDRKFDEQFLIQGTSVAWAREVFDPPTRETLVALAGLGSSHWRPKGITLDAGPPGVTIYCLRDLVWDSRHLLRFLELSVQMFRRLVQTAPGEVRVLSAEQVAAEGKCPVCAQVLESPTRACRSCGTTHHANCWDYFGGCAIYGCTARGGTPATRPKI